MTKIKFEKPVLNIDEKIQLLKDRGLIFEDEKNNKSDLSHIGYYRLSGYFKFFQDKKTNIFVEGTTFKEVFDLYIFDRKLRLLTLDVVEKIEVSLKANINDIMTEGKDAFWYLNPDCFYLKNPKNLENFGKLIGKIQSKKTDNESIIIKEFFDKYKGDYLPSWMLFEHLTIGEIANIYKVLKKQYQESISNKYDVNFLDLHTWIVLINKVRNISAHHSRLWNRLYNIRLKIDDNQFGDIFQKREKEGKKEVIPNYYNTALIINYLLNKINPNLSINFINELKQLFKEHLKIQKNKMGFNENWEQEFRQ